MRLRANLAALFCVALAGCSTTTPTTPRLSERAVTTLAHLRFCDPPHYRGEPQFVEGERWVLMRGPSQVCDNVWVFRISREDSNNTFRVCSNRFCYFISVSTDGDVADLYYRITGKEHPTLKGELSADYKAFLEGKR